MSGKKFYLALLIAVTLDLIDYLVVGFLPILGDAIDIIGIAMLLPLIGVYALFGVVEFVPVVGDLAPSFLVAVFASRTNLLKGLTGGGGEA